MKNLLKLSIAVVAAVAVGCANKTDVGGSKFTSINNLFEVGTKWIANGTKTTSKKYYRKTEALGVVEQDVPSHGQGGIYNPTVNIKKTISESTAFKRTETIIARNILNGTEEQRKSINDLEKLTDSAWYSEVDSNEISGTTETKITIVDSVDANNNVDTTTIEKASETPTKSIVKINTDTSTGLINHVLQSGTGSVNDPRANLFGEGAAFNFYVPELANVGDAWVAGGKLYVVEKVATEATISPLANIADEERRAITIRVVTVEDDEPGLNGEGNLNAVETCLDSVLEDETKVTGAGTTKTTNSQYTGSCPAKLKEATLVAMGGAILSAEIDYTQILNIDVDWETTIICDKDNDSAITGPGEKDIVVVGQSQNANSVKAATGPTGFSISGSGGIQCADDANSDTTDATTFEDISFKKINEYQDELNSKVVATYSYRVEEVKIRYAVTDWIAPKAVAE